VKLPPILFNHTVTVEPSIGETAYGPKFGSPVELKVRVISRRRLVKTGDGEDLMSDATVQADADAPIDLGARVTLDGRTLTAVQVLKPEALNGKATHREVLLG
jgi:hypothetical protein